MTLLLLLRDDTVLPLEPAPVASAIYEEVGVTQPRDRSLNWPFLVLCIALEAALGRVPQVVGDTDDGPSWSPVMDLDRAPGWALPWLAQFVGVPLRASDSTEASRARIGAHAQFQRGTPAAMRAAARLTLSGPDPHISIVEHADGNPWLLQVFTLTDETPDPAATLTALKSQKPAGLKLEHEVVDGLTWNEATDTWDSAPAVSWDDVSVSNPV